MGFPQGKGEVFTYWLLDEDKSIRDRRVVEDHQKKLSLEHRGSSTETPTMDSGSTLPAKQSSLRGKPQDEGAESSFYDLISDSTALSRNRSLNRAPSGSGGSRRRSTSSKDHSNSNGFLHRHATTEESVPLCEAPNSDTPLPMIVVDKTAEPSETDRLLSDPPQAPKSLTSSCHMTGQDGGSASSSHEGFEVV